MAEPSGADAGLVAEARTFVRHLGGAGAEDRVVPRYLEAHRRGLVDATGPAAAFDRWLVAFARRGPLRARLADAYASVFHRGGLLRRKLVLVFALLETGPAAHRTLLAPARRGRAAFLAGALGRGLLALLFLLAGLALFAPARLVLRTPAPGGGAAP